MKRTNPKEKVEQRVIEKAAIESWFSENVSRRGGVTTAEALREAFMGSKEFKQLIRLFGTTYEMSNDSFGRYFATLADRTSRTIRVGKEIKRVYDRVSLR